jgi:hypothetical protein
MVSPFWRAPSLAPRQHCSAALSTVTRVPQRRQREAGDAHQAPFPTGGSAPPWKDAPARPATRRAPASFLLARVLPGRLLIGTQLDTDQTLIDTAGREQWCQACLCRGYCPTSAKVPRGIEALRAAIAQAMEGSALAQTIRSRRFQCIRDASNERQQRGDVVLLYIELERQLCASEPHECDPGAVTPVVEQLQRTVCRFCSLRRVGISWR